MARSQDASPTASQNAASPAEPTNATQESAHFETEDPNSFAAKAIEIQDESDERGVSSEQTSEKSKEKDHSEPEVGSKTNHSSETRRRQLNLQEFNGKPFFRKTIVSSFALPTRMFPHFRNGRQLHVFGRVHCDQAWTSLRNLG